MYLGYVFRISVFGFVIFIYYIIVKCILNVMYLVFLYLDL